MSNSQIDITTRPIRSSLVCTLVDLLETIACEALTSFKASLNRNHSHDLEFKMSFAV